MRTERSAAASCSAATPSRGKMFSNIQYAKPW